MSKEGTSNLLRVLFVFASSFLLSSLVYAKGPSCSNLLKRVSSNPLTAIQDEIDNASTLQEANDLTYEKVALGNNILDQAIDEMIAMNTQPHEDPALAEKQANKIGTYLYALQEAFKIPAYVMDFAISNRLEIEQAEYEKGLRAESRRRVIGFKREESATDYNNEPSHKQPIGFLAKDLDEGKVDSKSLLLMLLKENMVEEAPEVEETKVPVGFVPPKENPIVDAEDSTPAEPVGFIPVEKPIKSFTQDDIVKIVLSIEFGEFRTVQEQEFKPIQ